MLFREDALDRIRAGRVSVVFRRWRQARVRAGTRLRTMIGLIEIRSIAEVTTVDDTDARLAGYPSAAELQAEIPGDPANPLFRMEVSYAGPDPRIALREEAPSPDLPGRLDQMDARSKRGPWTRTILHLIATHPAVRAGGPARSST